MFSNCSVEFNDLYHLMEVTRMRLNWCLEKMQDAMEKGGSAPEDEDKDGHGHRENLRPRETVRSAIYDRLLEKVTPMPRVALCKSQAVEDRLLLLNDSHRHSSEPEDFTDFSGNHDDNFDDNIDSPLGSPAISSFEDVKIKMETECDLNTEAPLRKSLKRKPYRTRQTKPSHSRPRSESSTKVDKPHEPRPLPVGAILRTIVPRMRPKDSEKTSMGPLKKVNTLPKENAKSFPCDCGCNHVFKHKHHLERHQRSNKAKEHAPNVRYACGFAGCSKTYQSRDTLTDHFRIHTEPELPWKCDKCGKKFSSRSNRNNHIRYCWLCKYCGMWQSGEKTYQNHLPKCPGQKGNKKHDEDDNDRPSE